MITANSVQDLGVFQAYDPVVEGWPENLEGEMAEFARNERGEDFYIVGRRLYDLFPANPDEVLLFVDPETNEVTFGIRDGERGPGRPAKRTETPMPVGRRVLRVWGFPSEDFIRRTWDGAKGFSDQAPELVRSVTATAAMAELEARGLLDAVEDFAESAGHGALRRFVQREPYWGIDSPYLSAIAAHLGWDEDGGSEELEAFLRRFASLTSSVTTD